MRDEEHAAGARITLEQRQGMRPPFAITCGVYGWFFHTRYCSNGEEARHDFEAMKLQLGRIVDLLSKDDGSSETTEHAVLEAISDFVEHFPT